MDIMIDSIKYCQREKGLLIYAWVVMSNHLHMIISCKENSRLRDIIRNFKKFTSRMIVLAIQNSPVESRKRWLLWLLKQKQTDGKEKIAF